MECIRQWKDITPEAWGSGEDYEYLMGRWSRLLAPKFLEWVRVPTDGSILDVGCGTGALLDAISKLGVQAVVGLDPSPRFVELATFLLREKGSVSVRVGNAMDLPFPDGRFAGAVSSLVLNFVPDALRAAREMCRVVRGGGVVAACVWDYAGRMEMLRTFWNGAVDLNPDIRSRDEGVRFSNCNPEKLAGLFREAALARVETTNVDIPMEFANFEDYWRPFLGGQGPSGGYTMSLTEDKRQELRELLRSRLEARDDGTIVLTARAWAVRGIKE